jgi:hypothetical protein
VVIILLGCYLSLGVTMLFTSVLSKSLLVGFTFLSFAQAFSIPSTKSDIIARDSSHGPQNRGSWSDGFDIDTDYYKCWPDTGNTVSYELTVSDEFCDPDGHGGKMCQLVNGQYPGPVI